HVREYIDVHEQAVRLSCEQLTPLAVGVPQPDGRLAGIRADAEHVELEFEVDGWGGITGRERPLHPEAALLHAETRLPVGTEFTLWGCDPRGTERVLPVGIDALGVLDPVRHREAVDLEVFRRLLGTHGVRCTRSDDSNHRDERRRCDSSHNSLLEEFVTAYLRTTRITLRPRELIANGHS